MEIDQIVARNTMLEADNRLLVNKIKELRKYIKNLEQIIKQQDLQIQEITSGNQKELF